MLLKERFSCPTEGHVGFTCIVYGCMGVIVSL